MTRPRIELQSPGPLAKCHSSILYGFTTSLRMTITLNNQLRKFLMFMVKVS